MDSPELLSRRARRALPLMAGALAAIVVAGLVYLHPFSSSSRAPAVRPSPSPPVISALYSPTFDFVSPSTGWALVVDKLDGPGHAYLFRTTDGARNWQKQFTRSSQQPGISWMRFFDHNRGLICFGFPAELYRTSDAGNHWAAVVLPPYPASSITFSDPLDGWIRTQEPDPGLANHFFSTTDGGSSWTELPWPRWAVSGDRLGVGGDLQFRRASDGWMGAGADQPIVYSTLDGGASWRPHVMPGLPMPSPGTADKTIPPGGLGLTFYTYVRLLPEAGVVAIVDSNGYGAAYTSFDGGKSWRALALPPVETSYSDFVYQDSTHWWAMRFGTLWKSSDAGQSWKLVGQQLDDWDYRPHVIDANHAWAELYGSIGTRFSVTGLAMTSDAGLHWTYANVPKPG
jgi:photosystem II stability/assembly factor-like uncharacterized protein